MVEKVVIFAVKAVIQAKQARKMLVQAPVKFLPALWVTSGVLCQAGLQARFQAFERGLNSSV
jgi:hypothetical protein